MYPINRLLFQQPRLCTSISASFRYFGTTKKWQSSGKNVEIKNVTIAGGGVMGAGIAQAAAQSGFSVTVVDSDEYTQKCEVYIRKSLDIIASKKFPDEHRSAKKFIDDILQNIKTTRDLKNGCSDADLVIEAVVEDLNVKKEIFKDFDKYSPAHSIFASNTSSLSIGEMASALSRPEQLAGLHFFNPVWRMNAVEVIKAANTSSKTFETLVKFVEDLGKRPVKCLDTPGFIVNRLLFPYMMEALRFSETGHASTEDIDTAMKLGAGYPMGPFQLMDHIGLDIVKSVIDVWHAKEPENPLYFPSDTLNNLVVANKLGKKTGQGFYKYKHTFHY